MNTHTPGPWNLGGVSNPRTDPRYSIWGPTPPGKQSGEWIAKDVAKANARLIAAAPELLAALKAILEAFDRRVFVRNVRHDDDPNWAIDLIPHLAALANAQTAIAKAEGA